MNVVISRSLVRTGSMENIYRWWMSNERFLADWPVIIWVKARGVATTYIRLFTPACTICSSLRPMTTPKPSFAWYWPLVAAKCIGSSSLAVAINTIHHRGERWRRSLSTHVDGCCAPSVIPRIAAQINTINRLFSTELSFGAATSERSVTTWTDDSYMSTTRIFCAPVVVTWWSPIKAEWFYLPIKL